MTDHSKRAGLPRVTDLSHDWVSRHLGAGGFAIDATAGNGHDTLFLAQLVGTSGFVCAFDVQGAAIRATKERLSLQGCLDQVTLHQRCHAEMSEVVGERKADAIMFNLGYLPGGDKEQITRTKTTLKAIDSALTLLGVKGILTVVVYGGHPGGDVEAAAVKQLLCGLSDIEWRVACYGTVNAAVMNAPELFGVVRIGGVNDTRPRMHRPRCAGDLSTVRGLCVMARHLQRKEPG